MKRQLVLWLTVILLLSGLAGCRQASPAAESGTADRPFTRDTLPRLDGSTANIPLALLMLQRVAGLSAEEADTLVEKVFGGSAELLFASILSDRSLSKDELARLKALVEEYEG